MAAFNGWLPTIDLSGESFDFLLWNSAVTLTAVAMVGLGILLYLYPKFKRFINLWQSILSNSSLLKKLSGYLQKGIQSDD